MGFFKAAIKVLVAVKRQGARVTSQGGHLSASRSESRQLAMWTPARSHPGRTEAGFMEAGGSEVLQAAMVALGFGLAPSGAFCFSSASGRTR